MGFIKASKVCILPGAHEWGLLRALVALVFPVIHGFTLSLPITF